MTNKGFTLIEMLVAMTISALLLATAYGVVRSVSLSRDRLADEGEAFHLARVISERLARELRGAYYSAHGPETRFVGGVDDRGATFLQLATTAATPTSSGGGLVRVRYRLDRENGAAGILLRDEHPLHDDSPEEPPRRRLAAGIQSLELRFGSATDRQPLWDSLEQGGLPDLVEVNLTIETDGGPLPFMTVIELAPLYKSL